MHVLYFLFSNIFCFSLLVVVISIHCQRAQVYVAQKCEIIFQKSERRTTGVIKRLTDAADWTELNCRSALMLMSMMMTTMICMPVCVCALVVTGLRTNRKSGLSERRHSCCCYCRCLLISAVTRGVIIQRGKYALLTKTKGKTDTHTHTP